MQKKKCQYHFAKHGLALNYNSCSVEFNTKTFLSTACWTCIIKHKGYIMTQNLNKPKIGLHMLQAHTLQRNLMSLSIWASSPWVCLLPSSINMPVSLFIFIVTLHILLLEHRQVVTVCSKTFKCQVNQKDSIAFFPAKENGAEICEISQNVKTYVFCIGIVWLS